MSLRDRTAEAFSSDEEYEDSAVSRLLLVVTAALMFRGGFMLWSSLEPGGVFSAGSVLLLYAAGVQLLVFAATGLSLQTHGRALAYGVAACLLLAAVAAVMKGATHVLGTDSVAFAQRSADLTLAGKNPYQASMAPAMDLPGSAHDLATPLINGDTVDSLSYPAGSVLVFLPAAALDVQLRLVSMLGAFGVAAWLIYQSPPSVALGGVVATIGASNLVMAAMNGTFDALWILPLLVGMTLWADDRRMLAAVAIGVAASIKQHSWMMLPFLLVWVWETADSPRAFIGDAARPLGAGLATFGVINAPFIVMGPAAWLRGVFTPVATTAPLIQQGVGLAALATVGGPTFPTWFHGLLIGGAMLTALTAYSLWFDELRWIAFVAPAGIWFVHSRSLPSYFAAMVPLAWMAVLLRWDVHRSGDATISLGGIGS